MTETPLSDLRYEVVCPHCKKEFEGVLMSGHAARHQGFKCPHCRLFVPYRAADGRDGSGHPAGGAGALS